MHIHLDLLGGMAGDMFAGALMDLHPEHAEAAIAGIRAAGIDERVVLEHLSFTDGVLSGSRFNVELPKPNDYHHHVHWSALRETLQRSELERQVCDRATEIFELLAEAEAEVHEKPVDEVAFHEVGAWDSIADIVAAATLIEALGSCSWSIGAIPIGSGRVGSDHGLLPVPAPATTLLLAGYPCFDDGFAGERVTPTGAAIIKHLQPTIGLGITPRTLTACGYGFGTRRFEGMSNVLRVIEFTQRTPDASQVDSVGMINFEIDDQTAEDLAIALNQIRHTDGVLDVVQYPLTGKGGRQATSVQVLTRPEKIDTIVDTCFSETTTIGLRVQTTERRILRREESTTSNDVAVKVVDRPGRRTAKADSRSVSKVRGFAARDAKRRRAESEVMARFEKRLDDDGD